MASFEIAHKKTAIIEGGYVNDPDDNGGETYRGIARKFHSSWRGWELIDEFKESKHLKTGDFIPSSLLNFYVDEFYQVKFWDINKLSDISCQEIANELFDTGVNMGTRTAAKMLQESLNLLNKNEKTFKDLKVDGVIGNKTISTLNSFNHFNAVLKTLNGLQFMKYVLICKADPAQEIFFNGWLKRI